MVYIIFNILLSISMIFFANQFNKKVKDQIIEAVSIPVAMLLTIIATCLFTLLLVVKEFGYKAFVTFGMKLVFTAEGCGLVLLSYSLIELGQATKHKLLIGIKYLLYAVVVYIVFFKITIIELDPKFGMRVLSPFVFKGFFRHFVPIQWFELFNLFFRFVLPLFCFIVLIMLQERHGVTQLEKLQSIIIGSSLVLMWFVYLVVRYVSHTSGNTRYLYMFSYSYMYIVIYMALTKNNVPSGKATWVSLFKVVVSYIIPSLVIGYLVAYFQPIMNEDQMPFYIRVACYGSAFMLIAINLSYLLSSSTKLYTAEYGKNLEKELAAIEYREADMDVITEKWYEILKKNAESSSLNVYILSSPSELTTAYSSNGLNKVILTNNVIFDVLLNINKNIVVYSEIEKEHDLASIQEDLQDFFEYTESDALFILNEGHNIFGVITLGKKVAGDHFKLYDYNVFEKLYSYFFVFGYYMRNISNRDIIGIVNREVKMSSQIITSIQENIDKVKNPKVDVGYLMVPAHNIGGEFIDLIRLTDTRHLFVVGDLSGKGIGASMNMVILKSIIRTHLAEIHDFKELVVRINTFVRESLPKGTIFSGLFALVDFETDTMYYINCGVPALMMYTQVYNNVIEIQGSGHVLGFVKDIAPYISVKTTKLNKGDILLACTDGLVQSHSLRGESFGKERIQHSMLDNASFNAQRMANFCFDNLQKFMSREMEDDVSILVIKYEGSSTSTKDATPKTEAIEEVKEEKVEPKVVDTHFNVEESVGEKDIPLEEKPIETKATVAKVQKEKPQVNEESKEENHLSDFTADLNDPDLPDLSDLDALMKEAGL